MNETLDPRPAVVTMTYEYIPGMPANFTTVYPVWLDIAPCDAGSLEPAYANTTFNYTGIPWTSPIEGEILLTGGHIHDGGVNIEIFQNEKMICNSSTLYGMTPGYVESISSMPMSMTMNMSMGIDNVHISNMSTCSDVGTLHQGDNLTVQAFYNTNLHAPMMGANGTLEPIMGIALVYVANGTAANATSSNSTSTTGGSMFATSSGSASVLTNGLGLAAILALSGTGLLWGL
jgi:hypothetical protein